MYYVTGDIKTRKVKINTGDGKGAKLLSPEHSLKLANKSPDGFAWGYAGSGPAQLALAILLTCTTEEDAMRLFQTFKDDYVLKFPQRNFSYKVPIRKWLIKNGAKYILNDADFKPYVMGEDDNVGRACGEQCTKAISSDCNCSCGGQNHGTEAVNKKQTAPAEPFANKIKAEVTPTVEPTTVETTKE